MIITHTHTIQKSFHMTMQHRLPFSLQYKNENIYLQIFLLWSFVMDFGYHYCVKFNEKFHIWIFTHHVLSLVIFKTKYRESEIRYIVETDMNEQKFGRHSFVSYGRFLYLFIDFVEYLRGFVIVVVDVFKQFPGKAWN